MCLDQGATIMKSTIFLFFLALLSPQKSTANDDDLLLSIVPTIAATSAWKKPALAPIRKLAGEWTFTSFFARPKAFFRFDQTTARQINGSAFGLQHLSGDSSLNSEFSSEWCDGKLLAIYYPLYKDYVILCDWGFPTKDLGSVFSFTEVNNTFEYAVTHYRPSDNKILHDQYYDGGIARKSLSAQVSSQLNNAVPTTLGDEENKRASSENFKRQQLEFKKAHSERLQHLLNLIDTQELIER